MKGWKYSGCFKIVCESLQKPIWYEEFSEEFSNSSTEGYLSDDSECLDFQEIETEERVNQELLSERSTTDKETDSELQAHMDEPLADEEWLKNYRQQEEKIGPWGDMCLRVTNVTPLIADMLL